MPKILAIDDKQDNLISIRALLMNLIPDSTIITAQTGPEGIIKARKELPDTILLDIQMPYMDGYEVCKMLKSGELTKHIPIIMITAIRTDLESRVKGLEFGADAFLSKPIDESELVAQIKVMLRIKRAEDLLRNQVELLETTINERTKALKQSEESLHRLSAHLMSVREEERKGIAREIHDELGQSLTALKMDLAWLDKRIIEDHNNLHLKIESISELTDNIIESVRRISSELRPGVLDDLGLCAAIEWQVSEIESRTDIKCNLVFEPEEIEIRLAIMVIL